MAHKNTKVKITDQWFEKHRSWSQKTTVMPPPFPPHFLLQSLVDGRHLGDPLFDNLSIAELCKIRKSGFFAPLNDAPLPSWLDVAAVKRGQALHRKHFFCFLVALCSALLHGFVIGRFSEVLSLAGYTKDDRTTYVRYRDTSKAIVSWMSFDLTDPSSVGFQNIIRVRAMHTLARQSVRNPWQQLANGEDIGVPLSQYDLSLVQLAFCSLALNVLEEESGLHLSEAEKRDYHHLWRYIGHLLGIEPRFNLASSPLRSERALHELFAILPLLNKETRPCCTELVQGCVRAFGTFTPASRALYAALLYGAARPDVHLDTSWCNVRQPPKAYCAKIVGHLNPDTWWLPAAVWHQLFLVYIYLQILYPSFARAVEVVCAALPEKMHVF